MKVGIIGAGNMGGAIARGLAASNSVCACDITVCCPVQRELDAIKSYNSEVNVSLDNEQAVNGTDVVIVVVKPWLLDTVLVPLLPKVDFSRQTIVTVVAGATTEHIAELAAPYCVAPVVMCAMPNTAASVHESMTFLCARNASPEQIEAVKGIFDCLGATMVIEERLMGAGMALASCGIAYAMRYVRAAMKGGVEMGMYPNDAKNIVLQTLKGAVALLEATGNHPEVEIDKVTTPGGVTIKGLNAMETNGFTHAVIEGLKASNPNL
ncbi:MAG: pyrroline-5-carboxylate reductase [Bacteroidales bacterium]|nr:pyrroline-5-carboxylate reductase [Bacteroidales bacterium]